MILKNLFMAAGLALLAATPAHAQSADRVLPPLPAGATMVTLSAAADTKLPEDTLAVTMVAQEKGTNQGEVQATINNEIKGALSAAGNPDHIKITTGSYNVWPQYTDNDLVRNWNGQQTLRMEGTDFGRILKIAGLWQQRGLNMQGMSYYLSDAKIKAQHDALLKQAVEKAVTQARTVADTLGLKKVQVVSVNTDSAPIYRPRPMMAMAKASFGAAEAAPPQGRAGEQQVSVSVSVMAYLLP